jgi:hypothetical protein
MPSVFAAAGLLSCSSVFTAKPRQPQRGHTLRRHAAGSAYAVPIAASKECSTVYDADLLDCSWYVML